MFSPYFGFLLIGYVMLVPDLLVVSIYYIILLLILYIYIYIYIYINIYILILFN